MYTKRAIDYPIWILYGLCMLVLGFMSVSLAFGSTLRIAGITVLVAAILGVLLFVWGRNHQAIVIMGKWMNKLTLIAIAFAVIAGSCYRLAKFNTSDTWATLFTDKFYSTEYFNVIVSELIILLLSFAVFLVWGRFSAFVVVCGFEFIPFISDIGNKLTGTTFLMPIITVALVFSLSFIHLIERQVKQGFWFYLLCIVSGLTAGFYIYLDLSGFIFVLLLTLFWGLHGKKKTAAFIVHSICILTGFFCGLFLLGYYGGMGNSINLSILIEKWWVYYFGSLIPIFNLKGLVYLLIKVYPLILLLIICIPFFIRKDFKKQGYSYSFLFLSMILTVVLASFGIEIELLVVLFVGLSLITISCLIEETFVDFKLPEIYPRLYEEEKEQEQEDSGLIEITPEELGVEKNKKLDVFDQIAIREEKEIKEEKEITETVEIRETKEEKDKKIKEVDETKTSKEITDEKEDKETKEIKLIENPLPLPKKHIKKEIQYDYEIPVEKLYFDYKVSDTDDFDY